MSTLFQTLGGSFPSGAHAFNPARERRGTLVAWGLVLAGLWLAAMAVATVTAAAWAHGAAVY